MNVFDWLSTAISWLDAQGGFTQAIVSALVLAAGAAIWSGLVRVFRRRQARRQERATALLQLQEVLDADFRSEPAELGEVDHGVNTTATLESVQALLYEGLPPLTAIIEKLFKETLDKLPPKGVDGQIVRKQAILKGAAREIHSHVLSLESVAKRIAPQSRAFINAYRKLLSDHNLSEDEKRSLLDLRETYRTGVAQTFLQVSQLLERRRQDISRLEGKQQDLTRMIRRTVRALRDTERAVRDVSKFCSGELAKTIERLVRG